MERNASGEQSIQRTTLYYTEHLTYHDIPRLASPSVRAPLKSTKSTSADGRIALLKLSALRKSDIFIEPAGRNVILYSIEGENYLVLLSPGEVHHSSCTVLASSIIS